MGEGSTYVDGEGYPSIMNADQMSGERVSKRGGKVIAERERERETTTSTTTRERGYVFWLFFTKHL